MRMLVALLAVLSPLPSVFAQSAAETKKAVESALKYFREDFSSTSSEQRIQALQDLCETTRNYRDSKYGKKLVAAAAAGLDDPHVAVRAACVRSLSMLAEPDRFARMMATQANRWILDGNRAQERSDKAHNVKDRDEYKAEAEAAEANLATLVDIFSYLKDEQAIEITIGTLEKIADPSVKFGLQFRVDAVQLLERYETPNAIACLGRLMDTYMGLSKDRQVEEKIATLNQAVDKSLRAIASKHGMEAPSAGAAADGAWATFVSEYAKRYRKP